MTNALEYSSADAIRAARADRLDKMLDAERWTNRKIAAATGLTHTYVGRRRSGSNDLSLPDIEIFAGLLKLRPAQLFDELMRAGNKKGPESGVSGPSLPDLDSNQEPAGITPAPIQLVPRRSSKPAPVRPGIVTPMHRSGTTTRRSAS